MKKLIKRLKTKISLIAIGLFRKEKYLHAAFLKHAIGLIVTIALLIYATVHYWDDSSKIVRYGRPVAAAIELLTLLMTIYYTWHFYKMAVDRYRTRRQLRLIRKELEQVREMHNKCK